jgi:hypothetical protein
MLDQPSVKPMEMEEKIEYGARGEAIVDNVFIGDNVAIPCELCC